MNEAESKKSLVSKGFILVIFTIFSVCLIIAIPNFIKARAIRSSQPCINNLRQIDAAANQFAIERHNKTGELINFPNDLTPYLQASKIPSCPCGGIYSLKKVGDEPACSLAGTITNGILHVLPQ